jgi:hypothetical protein
MRIYVTSCCPCLLVLDLICALRERSRRNGGRNDDNNDDKSMDMASGGSDYFWRRGLRQALRGKHDDEERLVVSISKGDSNWIPSHNSYAYTQTERRTAQEDRHTCRDHDDALTWERSDRWCAIGRCMLDASCQFIAAVTASRRLMS